MPSETDAGFAFRLVPAAADDWPWILPRYAEAAWDSLPAERQQATSRDRIQAQLQQQVEDMRSPDGRPNVAYVAWNENDERAGFVWAIESVSGFTGQAFGWVMCVHVERPWRGQGLGRRLMEAAEAWARERGIGQITLNVSARNAPARGLYDSLGYEIESIRMSKALPAQPP
jgi:ribosomal protein S18 acetylase RimI-like enzyme